MYMENEADFDLTETYAFLEDGGAAPLVPTGEAFWEDLMSGDPRTPEAMRVAHGNGWLVAVYRIEQDSEIWEMHPSGDELLTMISGEMSVILDQPGGEVVVDLPAGRTCIVPRGIWHRQVVGRPGTFLGATYGKGTRHRSRSRT